MLRGQSARPAVVESVEPGGDGGKPRGTRRGKSGGAARPRRWLLLAVFALQLALLTIGFGRQYELKHEDNNALHATFARSHLELGLAATRGQNYFYSRERDVGEFYAHHPPGPAWALALVFGVTGNDGPATTRAVAIGFHLLATWLFYCLVSRAFGHPVRRGPEGAATGESEALLATTLFAVLPESAFFGRMMNHEVLVLPAALLLVLGYWTWERGILEPGGSRWPAKWSVVAMVGGAAWAAASGWAGFFVMGACGLHAAWECGARRNRRAALPLLLVSVGGVLLFAIVVLQLVWVIGGDAAYLGEVLVSRAGADNPRTIVQWGWKVLELHWRYFGVASVCAVFALGYRAVRGLKRPALRDSAVDVASIFLVAGAGYVTVFNVLAARHDYWQFLLLPASAIGLTLVYRWILAGRSAGWPRVAWVTLLILVTFDIVATATYTLQDRHRRTESYCQRLVEELTRQWL